jgi:hypothetical protein
MVNTMKVKSIIIFLLIFSLLSSAFIQASQTSVSDTIAADQDGDDETETSDSEDTESSDHEDETDTTDTDDDDGETDTTDDHEDDDDEKEERDAYEREVEFEQQDREFKAKSALKNGDNKDEFELEFKVGGGDEPEIKLKYKTESSSSETELEYKIEFDRIIEFSENSSVVGFDTNDTILSEYEMDKMDWDPIVYSEVVENGVTIYSATASTSDGVFVLRMYLAGSFADVNGSALTPNALKIDVEIHNYDYISNSSYLSLETDIKSQSEYEEKEDTVEEQAGFASNEAQVSIGNSNAAGYFSWVETAIADGVDVPVKYSGLITEGNEDDDDIESEQKGTAYFTFEAESPKDLIWDPKVGVVSEGALSLISAIQDASNVSEALSSLPGFELFLTVFTIIGLTGLTAIRRKRH